MLTITITWWFIQWIDNLVDAVHPAALPAGQLSPFSIPGFGVVVALVFITLLGFLTRNYVGSRLVAFGESLLGRMPIVRSLYRGLKQIFETVVSTRAKAFQTVGLIEYPRKGLWAIVFLAGDAQRRDRASPERDGRGVPADDAEPDLGLPALRQAERGHDPRHVAGGRRQAGHLRRPGDAGVSPARSEQAPAARSSKLNPPAAA